MDRLDDSDIPEVDIEECLTESLRTERVFNPGEDLTQEELLVLIEKEILYYKPVRSFDPSSINKKEGKWTYKLPK